MIMTNLMLKYNGKKLEREVTMLSEQWEADKKNGLIVEANRLGEIELNLK